MSNPEQDAFRLTDKVDENVSKQNDATNNLQNEVIQARVEQTEKTKVADAGDQPNHAEALLKSMDKIQQLASRLPEDMLASVIDNNKGYIQRELLTGIDPRDAAQRDAIMTALKNAVA